MPLFSDKAIAFLRKDTKNTFEQDDTTRNETRSFDTLNNISITLLRKYLDKCVTFLIQLSLQLEECNHVVHESSIDLRESG